MPSKPEVGDRIRRLELVIVSDYIALRSDTWNREIDLLGMPRKAARQKMEAQARHLGAVGWKVVDEREDCMRPKQRPRNRTEEEEIVVDIKDDEEEVDEADDDLVDEGLADEVL